MLIFVQVCRTIDKNLVSIWSIGSERTNESNGINKLEALEESAPKVMTSSEAPHQKQEDQKMKESKLQRLFKGFNHV